MRYRPQIGDMVRILFRDHSQSGTGGLDFYAQGTLLKITRKDYTISPWHYRDMSRVNLDDEAGTNVETFSIVRKAIHRVDRLVTADPTKR